MWWFGLRIYAVTKGNKLLTGALCVLIAAQLCFGVFSLIRAVMGSCELLDRFFVRVWTHRLPAVPVPDINIDAFRVCFLGRWRLGELLYINLAIAFGMSPLSQLQRNCTSGVLIHLTPYSPRRGIRSSRIPDRCGHSQEIEGG